MTDEKPMTVKERMALLAKASSGNGAASSNKTSNNCGTRGRNPGNSTAIKTESVGRSQKGSVAERFAKLRRDKSVREDAGGACSSDRQVGDREEASGPTRASQMSSPETSHGPAVGEDPTGSSIAQRIAMLHGASSQRSAGNSGTCGSMKPESVTGASSSRSAPGKPSGIVECSQAPSIGQYASEKTQVPPPVCSDLKALAQALNARADKDRVDGRGNEAGVVGTKTCGEESLSLPPPSSAPASAVTSSGARMSPGLAARMQALRASPGSAGAVNPLSRGATTGVNKNGDTGRAEIARPSAVGGAEWLGVGKGVPIPLPGVITPADLSDLKRRKNGGQRPANDTGNAQDALELFAGSRDPADSAAESIVAGQLGGELHHPSRWRPPFVLLLRTTNRRLQQGGRVSRRLAKVLHRHIITTPSWQEKYREYCKQCGSSASSSGPLSRTTTPRDCAWMDGSGQTGTRVQQRLKGS